MQWSAPLLLAVLSPCIGPRWVFCVVSVFSQLQQHAVGHGAGRLHVRTGSGKVSPE